MPDHLAQVGQHGAERGLHHRLDTARIGGDLDIGDGEAARAGLACRGLEEGDGACIGGLRLRGQDFRDLRAEHLAHGAALDALIGVQHGKPDGLQDLRHELPAQMALDLRLPAAIPAERLAQEGVRVAQAGGAQRIGHLRQHQVRQQAFEHLVARNLEALAEFLARHDGVAVLHAPGHHHQVGGAAADVDRRHAQARVGPAFRPHAPGKFEHTLRIACRRCVISV